MADAFDSLTAEQKEAVNWQACTDLAGAVANSRLSLENAPDFISYTKQDIAADPKRVDAAVKSYEDWNNTFKQQEVAPPLLPSVCKEKTPQR